MSRISTAIAATFVVASFTLWALAADPEDKTDADRPHDDHRAEQSDRDHDDHDHHRGEHSDRDSRGGDRHFSDFRRGRFGSFRPPQIPLMTALDADKDGEISAGEIENATASLKSLDKNEDGKLTREETRPQFAFRSRSDSSRRDHDDHPPEHRRTARPEDRGSRDGAQGGLAWRGSRRDGGRGDGGRADGGRGPVRLVEHVMTLDSNDDDQLSQKEVLKLFSSADRDGDGFVSRGELEEAIVAQFRDHGPHDHGPPRQRPPFDGGRPPRDRDHLDHPDRPDRPE